MKKFYVHTFILFVLAQFALRTTSQAQCVDGAAPTSIVIDTTIAFEPGVTSVTVKFPQFDPEQGMVRGVNLSVSMTGVLDEVTMQNRSYSDQWVTFNYVRTDQMTGPGLSTALTNNCSKRYGPYHVTKFDGDYTSGTDSYSILNETVLQTTITRNLSGETDIAQFYGHDSLAYTYSINVSALASISGGSSMNIIMTSALVHFRFEYFICSKATLPIDLKNFSATKTSAQTANLSWEGENDEYAYNYDVEVSRDGKHFSTLSTLNKKYTANPNYQYSFALGNGDFGRYYYRIRQHWLNGYVRYSPVKSIEFANPLFASTSLYPNPSNGQAGIKFVNVKAGRMLVQISTASGQQVAVKEMNVAQTDYQPLQPLPTGMYWVKITDLATNTSCVKQLVVQ
jgi:hypothetical protein